MATTSIQISSSGEQLTASASTAPFNPGDSITFLADQDLANAVLCFSDSATDLLSPSPDGPVPLPGGSSVTYQIVGSPESGCCVNVVHESSEGTPDGGDAPAGTLFILTPKGRPGPPPPWQDGN